MAEAEIAGLAMARWRMMREDDLRCVFEISEAVHQNHPESFAVIEEKYRLFRMGCFVLRDRGDIPLGYCFSHPWSRESTPALNKPLGMIPPNPDIYFVHDMALNISARGIGHGGRLVRVIFDLCRLMHLLRIELISVNGTEPLWTAIKFARTDNMELQAKVRASYSDEAVHMYRTVEQFF